MAKTPDKPLKSPERYGRLLRGEITAKQYVKSLQQEARSHRAAKSGTHQRKRTTSA